MENELVAFGGYCKAIEGGRLVGPLVHFGSPGATDLSRYRDYFTPRTNFDLDGCSYKSRIYYDHGLDPVIRKRRIGSGGMTKDAVAIWIEGQLDLRDEYMAGIYALAQRNKLSWSSGTAPHLVERKAIETPEGIVHEVLSWPLGLDASVTPRPADPRSVVEVKSLVEGVAPAVPTFAELLAEPTIRIAVDRIRESAGAGRRFYSFPTESTKCGAVPPMQGVMAASAPSSASTPSPVPSFTFPTWIHDLQATTDVPLLELPLGPGRSDAPGLNPFCRTDRLPEGWWNLYMQYASPSVPAWWAESGYRYGVPWRAFVRELREQILRERALYRRHRSGRDLDAPENLRAADVRFDPSVKRSTLESGTPDCSMIWDPARGTTPRFPEDALDLPGGEERNPYHPGDGLPNAWRTVARRTVIPDLDELRVQRADLSEETLLDLVEHLYAVSRAARYRARVAATRGEQPMWPTAALLAQGGVRQREIPSTETNDITGGPNPYDLSDIVPEGLAAVVREGGSVTVADIARRAGIAIDGDYHTDDAYRTISEFLFDQFLLRRAERRISARHTPERRPSEQRGVVPDRYDALKSVPAGYAAGATPFVYDRLTAAPSADPTGPTARPPLLDTCASLWDPHWGAAPRFSSESLNLPADGHELNPFDPSAPLARDWRLAAQLGVIPSMPTLLERFPELTSSEMRDLVELLYLCKLAQHRWSQQLLSRGGGRGGSSTKSRCDCGCDDTASVVPRQSYPIPPSCDIAQNGASVGGGFTASGPAEGTVGDGFGMVAQQPVQPLQMVCTPLPGGLVGTTPGSAGYPNNAYPSAPTAGTQPWAPVGTVGGSWPLYPPSVLPWPPSGTPPGTPGTPPGTVTPPGTPPVTPPVVTPPTPPVQPPVVPPVFPPPPPGAGGGSTDGGLLTWVDFPYGPIPGYPATPPPSGYTGLPYPWWISPPPPYSFNHRSPWVYNPGQPVNPNTPGGAWPDPAYFATPEPDVRWPGTFADTVGEPEYRLLRWLLWHRKANGSPLDPTNPDDDWWWYWESIWYARGSREWYWLRPDGSRQGLKEMTTEFLLRYLTHMRAPNRTPYLPWLVDAVEAELKRRGVGLPSGAPAPAQSGAPTTEPPLPSASSPGDPPSHAMQAPPGGSAPLGYPGGSTSTFYNNGFAMNDNNRSPQGGYTKANVNGPVRGTVSEEVIVWAHAPGGGFVPLNVRPHSTAGGTPDGFHLQVDGPNGPVPMRLMPVQKQTTGNEGTQIGDELVVWGPGTIKASETGTGVGDELVVWVTTPDGSRHPMRLGTAGGRIGEEVIIWAHAPGGPIPLRLHPAAHAPMTPPPGTTVDTSYDPMVQRADRRTSIKSLRGLLEELRRGMGG